jgi:hypothetical protein
MSLMTKNIITFSFVGIFLAIAIVSVQQVYATGCPTNFVSEHIKNAKTALESGKSLFTKLNYYLTKCLSK